MTDQFDERSAWIQRRAQELAAGGGADELVAAADVLAGLQDGSLAFDDLDDRAVERLVETLGMETVVGAIAAIDRAAETDHVTPSAEQRKPVTTIASNEETQRRASSFWRVPVWFAAAAALV